MKRFFLILGVAWMLFFCAFGLKVGAAEEVGYVINEDGEELSLSSSGDVIKRGGINELLSHIPDGAAVEFSDVALYGDIEIPRGSFTFSGELKLSSGSITVREGSTLLLSDLELDLSENSSVGICVRGGSLRVASSDIVGGSSSAVSLDYSASSFATIESSSLECASTDAAVRILSGSLSVISGSIKNTLGIALESRAQLSLGGEPEISGVPCDVVSDRAISLSVGDVAYAPRYTLDVTYDGVFEDGCAYDIFTRCDDEATSRISLFDKNGKEYKLTYFTEHPRGGDSFVSMVYLPFTVRFADGTKEILTERVLKGDLVTSPAAPLRDGYEFSHWETAAGDSFDASSSVHGDLILYPRYRLLSPSFKISSLNIEYTGEEHTLAFGEVSHPLDKLGGFSQLVWYREGEIISRGQNIGVKNVSDSGEYSCLITYYFESDIASVLVEGITVNVSPKEITPPESEKVTYDGTPKLPSGLDGRLYTFDCEGFTDVGAYQITLKLRDGENTVFSGTGGDVAVVGFEITRAKNEFLTLPTVKSIYEGETLDFYCDVLFGEVYFAFSDKKDGEYVKTEPKSCGKYYVIARVDESRNYEALSSEACFFEIKKDYCVSLEISEREEAEYTAFDRFVGEGVSVLAKYKSGREETLGVSSLSVKYQRGSYLRWGDSGVILSYGGISVTYPLSVSKADYSLDALDLSEYRITYDGKYHEYPLQKSTIVGKDNIPLTVKTVGGGTNAGEYIIKVSFSTESTDYKTPPDTECVMIVERAVAKLSWSNLSFSYDGSKKKPSCSYTDVFGIVRYPEVYGEKTAAGSGYTAYVNVKNGNYSFSNESVEFEIKKGKYDLSAVKWQGGEFVYNGKEQSVILSGLPIGVSVVGYTDASATNAGEYLACATLAYDADNYEKPVIEAHEWKIHKASYDLLGFSIENDTVTFDGEAHYPKVVGNAPIGLDGIPLRYSFSRGSVHVTESDVGIRVEFSTDSPNYTVPDTRLLYVTVLPKEVSVVWQGAELIYSGGAQLPIAECGECEIEISGAGVNVGSYVATAKSKSTDYSVKNSSFPFKINKAQNKFVGEIKVEDVYTEREVRYEARCTFGKAEMLVYKDRECSEPTSIDRGGQYYLVFTVPESENYFELRSDVIEILAHELEITDLTVELLKSELRAFERLSSEDYVLTALYNDGSKEKCDASKIKITYQSADSLRRSDNEISFKFCDVETTLKITVGYASYDLSDVRWEGLEHTYDGEDKLPYIVGLPEGVTLLGFAEPAAKYAGEYPFTPMLSYDAENYSEPRVGAQKMVINKQIIPLRYQISVEYDGKTHIPTSEDALYSLSFNGEIREVGVYSVIAVLSDDENYAFSDGDCITFSVLPRRICVTVSDAEIKPDGAFGVVNYEITEGTVIDGDELALLPILTDGGVSLVTENKNYELIVTPCEPMSASRALGDVKVTLITLCISLSVIILATLIYAGRRRIFRKVYISSVNSEKAKGGEILLLPPPHAVDNAPKEIETQKEKEPPKSSVDDPVDEKVSDFMERAEKIGKVEIDMEKADSLITDALAKDLIKRADKPIKTGGYERSIINVDTISEYFYPGERVDINSLKRRGLIPATVSFVKVLARGRVDKPLSVYANEFTPAAVKMIVLSGGEAVKAQTVREKDE